MRQRHAVVLSGGGADGAYEVGVVRALVSGRAAACAGGPIVPEVWTGTSIGSLNAAFLVGSIVPLPWAAIGSVAAFVAAGLVLLFLLAHRLNLLAFGEETAGHLGLDVERTTWQVVISASLVTAAAVSFAGLVGFVGLIVPHAARAALGPDHRVLVPASALGGAAFLVLADAGARTVAAPVELPVGVVTALLGCPLFLALFLRRLREP